MVYVALNFSCFYNLKQYCQNNLAYNVNKCKGELYHMDISCFAEGVPRSECLYFKVIGTAEVKNGE